MLIIPEKLQTVNVNLNRCMLIRGSECIGGDRNIQRKSGMLRLTYFGDFDTDLEIDRMPILVEIKQFAPAQTTLDLFDLT